MFKFIFALALLGTCYASFTPVKQCASKLPLPVDVKVEECKKLPCKLQKGKDVTADVTFSPKEDVEDLTMKVKATVLGITTSYPLPDPKVCPHLTDNSCPIVADEEATYRLQFNIFEYLPSELAVGLEMTIESEKGGVACFQLDAMIV